MKTTPISLSCILCKKLSTIHGLANHYNRMHGTNADFIAKLKKVNKQSGLKRSTRINLEKMNECKRYYLNPKICSECGGEIDYFRRNNKTCSASCSAKISNKQKGKKSLETKAKIGRAVRLFHLENKNTTPRRHPEKKKCNVVFHKCSQCETIIMSKGKTPIRKTCSRECRIHASTGTRNYINGKRLNITYETITGENVLLESSWELILAKTLDHKGIKWVRPSYIKWIDSCNKSRNYYPDFYLTEFKLFIDPKNMYCIKTSIEKMQIVSTLIPVWYGDITMIINALEELTHPNFLPQSKKFIPD